MHCIIYAMYVYARWMDMLDGQLLLYKAELGQNQLKIAILGPKNILLSPKLVKTCIWVVLMNSKNLAQKS